LIVVEILNIRPTADALCRSPTTGVFELKDYGTEKLRENALSYKVIGGYVTRPLYS